MAERQPIVVARASAPIQVGRAPSGAVRVERRRGVLVSPPSTGYWQERRWTKRQDGNEEVYEGQYRVRDKRTGQQKFFRGRVVLTGGTTAAFVADPPPGLHQHPKRGCFQLLAPGSPWFKIHWDHAASNADEAILYLEKVLDEMTNPR